MEEWCKQWIRAILVACFLGGSVQSVEADETLIIGFGDSLMAGYGLPPGKGFPNTLERYLKSECGLDVRVINAGVSGDTSSGGRARLDWALTGTGSKKPDLVILELGANDALRGISPELTRENLDAVITSLKEKDIPILLAGMLAPPNMGENYQKRFNALYPALAEKHDIAFYPFFLDGVAANPQLNQADGIHPTEEGIEIITRKIAPYVEDALRRSSK